jgi:GT2 family glycosyltransferase
MDLSIVIVTWNNEREIGPCLRSVFSCAEGLKCEVYVVDNSSSDGTRKVIETAVDPGVRRDDVKIKTIWNDKNTGFAAAVNQGIQQSTGEYVLLLNPDTELMPGCLQPMLRYLRSHSDVGVSGGKILNTDGTLQGSVRRFPTAWDQAVILLKMHNFFPKIVAKYFCEGFNYDVEQEVDQVRGAYFWVSRKLLDKIGPLDAKNFFIWFEEVDYCRRAKDAGFKVMYVPSSVARHEGGASFAQEPSLQKQRWLNKSMRNYFRKHGTALDVIVVTLLSPVSLGLACLVQRFKIKPRKYV